MWKYRAILDETQGVINAILNDAHIAMNWILLAEAMKKLLVSFPCKREFMPQLVNLLN